MRKLLANLLDIRTVIGGIFTLYGLILTILGLIDDAAARAKAEGVDINLWVGLAMLLFGLCFLAWTFVKPRQGPTEKTGPDPLDEGAPEPGGLTNPNPPNPPDTSGSTAPE
ncbi:hypothetical protein LO762_17100 [Actinocorallia sp. API 0066]|uniref:hypothetical protein n=1 Tax=Actinocorallia sp. API 0066 TaxID=2896846 RepID=UPI001E3457EF|nr:hypothetical protein [Actinocorallia sp. API 0066]MCD0450899.1 hypothetical protein [Actinocorallia sp. API 0066]